MRDDTWVVIPVFNEAAVVGDVVAGLRHDFHKVVCVDDGSRDESAERARAAGARVVRHPFNLGQGAALQTGIRFAIRDENMRQVVTFDADGQHQVSDAVDMVERVRAGEAQVVFGSRFMGAGSEVGWLRRVVLRGAVVYSNLTTGARLSDAHNGLRVLSREVCLRLDLKQNQMAHASEIVAQVADHDFTYVEHPVRVVYSEYSRAKGQSVLNSVNIVSELLYRG